MRRRRFLAYGTACLTSGCDVDLRSGVRNPCLDTTLPPTLGRELIAAAWEGIEPARYWDVHAHLLGNGDSGSGAWINPDMQSLLHPMQLAQYKFYLNAACIDDATRMDSQYLTRLMACQAALPPGNRVMLLAFDYSYGERGELRKAASPLHVPNAYARAVAARYPERAEWIASIHPYREDAVQALEEAARGGARAVKWLPPAMSIDPASPRCDPFYEALAERRLPLLTHGGHERAVHGSNVQQLGNPLKLRRALDHGVKVIVAHCASLGEGEDLDGGASAPLVDNFALFARLMDDPRYAGLIYGGISAMTQLNRAGAPLAAIIERTDWHDRLLNGSDYPLPGVIPLFSLSQLVSRGLLEESHAGVLRAIRPHNPLLFDFVLKRSLRSGNKRLGDSIFETRRVFDA